MFSVSRLCRGVTSMTFAVVSVRMVPEKKKQTINKASSAANPFNTFVFIISSPIA